MVALAVRPQKADSKKYGETKLRYQIMLTETANSLLEDTSQKLGISRSEVLEIVIRAGALKLAEEQIEDKRQ